MYVHISMSIYVYIYQHNCVYIYNYMQINACVYLCTYLSAKTSDLRTERCHEKFHQIGRKIIQCHVVF